MEAFTTQAARKGSKKVLESAFTDLVAVLFIKIYASAPRMKVAFFVALFPFLLSPRRRLEVFALGKFHTSIEAMAEQQEQ